MDPDVDSIWPLFRHVFPDFSISHIQVYKLLWRVEPKFTDDIVAESGLSRATIYRVLHQLLLSGLIAKTSFKPVGYFAANPVKAYYAHVKKVNSLLENGKAKIAGLVQNSSSLSGELYLVKRDGGQQRLLLKENRAAIQDRGQLLELKKAIEKQIEETDKGKAKAWAVYR